VVRLKDRARQRIAELEADFNSSVVRLKAGRHGEKNFDNYTFQFQCGTIKSERAGTWFIWGNRFQFQCGTIKSSNALRVKCY